MKTIKEQFVTYEIALALKELGFDEPCLGYFPNVENSDKTMIFFDRVPEYTINSLFDKNPTNYHFTAPLWQQCVDWFREKYNYDIQIKYPHTETNKIEGINSVFYDIEIYKLWGGDAYKVYKFCQISDNYKCAREQAILKCIELCQKK